MNSTSSNISIKFNVSILNQSPIPIFIHFNEIVSGLTTGFLLCIMEKLDNFNELKYLVGSSITLEMDAIPFRNLIIETIEVHEGALISIYDNKTSLTVIFRLTDPMRELVLNNHYRCFNNLSVGNILRQIMYGYGIETTYDLTLPISNIPISLKIQYGETDFHFIQRICWEYGIFFFWQQDILKFMDEKSLLQSIEVEDYLFQFLKEQFNPVQFYTFTTPPKEVRIKSTDYTHASTVPQQNLKIKHTNNFTMGTRGIQEHFSNNEKNAQEKNILQGKNFYQYMSRERKVTIGKKFSYGSSNNKNNYITKETSHFFLIYNRIEKNKMAQDFIKEKLKTWVDPGVLPILWFQYSYLNVTKALLDTEVFTLGEIKAKPRANLQTAYVTQVGTGGSSCNEYGDIMIKFPWDNEPLGMVNITNMCWVRVAQLMCGEQYGINITPRPGQEVLVGFLQDDIDYPVVLGTLTNAINSPFYGDQLNKLSIKTNSIEQSVPGERFNELTFDDLNREELVYLRGQRDMAIDIIDGNFAIKMHSSMGNPVINSIEIVQGDMSIKLQKGNYDTTIQGDCNFQVSGDVKWEVGKKFTLKAASFLGDISGKTKIIANEINMESNSLLELVASNIKVHSKGDLALESINTDIKSASNILLKSSTMSTIESSMVNIKSPMLSVNVTGVFSILSGVFSVTGSNSISIIAPVGTLHGFPPFYM